MNIAVDLGNSFAKAACFEGDEMMQEPLKVTHEELLAFIEKNQPEKIIFGSVGEGLNQILRQISPDIRCIVADHTLKFPITSLYKTPETLGIDRLAGVIAAQYLYPKKNCLVIDIGTCVTYDVIDDEGGYQGGSISPGLFIKFKALHTFTSKLPFVEAVDNPPFIGKDTRESIQSGVISGTRLEIEGMIKNFGLDFPDLNTIICGGDAKFFESKIKAPIFVVPELVLVGLNRILQYNASSL